MLEPQHSNALALGPAFIVCSLHRISKQNLPTKILMWILDESSHYQCFIFEMYVSERARNQLWIRRANWFCSIYTSASFRIFNYEISE
jgi:hypothetical protein